MISAVNTIGRELNIARRHIEFVLARLPSRERRCYKRLAARRSEYFNAYWHDVAAKVEAEIDNIGYGFFRLRRDNQSTYVRHGEVMLDDHLTLEMAGNKPLISRLLAEQGYCVAPFIEYGLDSIHRAFSFMQRYGGNFVVKPAAGSGGGRGITTKINSRKRLVNASFKAAIHCSGNRLLIEKEHPGSNYRLLYLQGQFIDAIRRDAPGVTGDGKTSLKNLIDGENRRRLDSDEIRALSPLTIDLDTRYTLADQGMSLQQVPPAGSRLKVKTTTNQNSRYENTSVRDSVHPSIVEYGRRVSEVIDVTFCGVDMMMENHESPVKESGCLINEINTTPGLHHHDLISRAKDRVEVGATIIDYIFTRAVKPAVMRKIP